MTTDSEGGLVAASAGGEDDARPRERRRVEVSTLRASQVEEYARRRADAGAEVHVERRGGRTFIVAAGP